MTDAVRDTAVVALSFSAVHVGLNMLSVTADDTPRCPYDEIEGFVISLSVFCLFSFGLWVDAGDSTWKNTFAMTRDLFGILPGIWYQITTKPNGFYAGVPVENCSLRESGYAMALWTLGELLSFGSGVRVARTVGFGRRFWPTILILIAGGALQMITELVAASMNAS